MLEIDVNNETILSYSITLEKQLEVITNLIKQINKIIDEIYNKEIDTKEALGFKFSYLDFTNAEILKKWINDTRSLIDYFKKLAKDNKHHEYILEKQTIYLDLCLRMQNWAIKETIDLSLRLDEMIMFYQMFDEDYSLS